MLDAPHLSRAAEPGLDLVDHEDDAVVVADPADALEELRRSDHEPALALDGLDDDRGDALRRDLRHERPLEGGERVACTRPAVILCERHAIDVRGERPEAGLVRMRLRGQRERQQRAAVEPAFESDHRGTLRERARELDGVLDRFGAGVEKRSLDRAGDRRRGDEALRQRDVELVRDDREVRMEELRGLLLDRLDHARVGVADVQAADAAREVDEGVAVDVGERCPLAVVDHDRDVDRERVRNNQTFAHKDLLRPWPRNGRLELDRLGRSHQRGR